MRIDGFSPAYVPNRTTRPDAIAEADAAVRQGERQNRQTEALSQNIRPETLQAIAQLQEQEGYQRYQDRQTDFPRQQLSWQNQQAMASYSTAASFSGEESKDATQVLGLDLYA